MYYKRKILKAGAFSVGKLKLNYSFNNPNTLEDTTDMLLKFFVEINKPKVEQAIRIATEKSEEIVSHPK